MDALVERLSQGASLRDLTLHRTQAPDGTISERWQIDNDEDLCLFRKNQTWANAAEVAAIGALDFGEPVQSQPVRRQVAPGHCLRQGKDGLLASIQSRTLPKTYTIKKDFGCGNCAPRSWSRNSYTPLKMPSSVLTLALILRLNRAKSVSTRWALSA